MPTLTYTIIGIYKEIMGAYMGFKHLENVVFRI